MMQVDHKGISKQLGTVYGSITPSHTLCKGFSCN